ncbi:MAG: uncharacterized protein QOK11_3153 [Pseudonocardiales bacterium]|nr:uncharacterized protein [Pseudonocardiales bacterium]
MIDSLLVIAKEPIPGRVKTRLVPPLTHEHAAHVAGAALADTLRAGSAIPARRHVLVLDGRPGTWLTPGWRLVPQAAGDLDVRLAAAFAAAAQGPALLVGMDTPQLQPRHLTAFDPEHFDACLGPAADGGFWALSFRDPRNAAAAIAGVPMSTAGTGAQQLRRLRALGLRVQLLDELRDVDTFDDAQEVACLVPDSAFAHAVDTAARDRGAAVR